MLNGIAADDTSASSSPGELSLLDTRVDSLQRLQEGDKLRRELLEGGDLRCEERVAAGRRRGEEEEGRQAGRLELVRNVGVPDRGGDAVVDFEVETGVSVSVDEVDLWVAFGVP